MQRFAMMPLAAALTLALAAPGFGQATGGSGSTGASGQSYGKAPAPAAEKAPPAEKAPAQAPTTPAAVPAEPATPSLQSQLEANNTQSQAHKKLEVIKVKGGMTSAQARSKADAKFGVASKKADADAAAQGDDKIAARLAAEFGMKSEDLVAERQGLGVSWGELMIARSLRAMSTTEVSVAQLFELRKEDTGWGQIAAGLGLKLGEAVSAVQAESKVAAGLVEPDGKVAAIPESGRAHGKARASGAAAAGSQSAAQAGTIKP